MTEEGIRITSIPVMPNHIHIVLRLLLIWVMTCFIYACNGVTNKTAVGPANPGMSPVPIAVADMHPWKKAQEIAEQIPNSDVMIGHGDVMLPLYPDGTVLVLQKLQLDHLRSGMTVVLQASRNASFDLRASVLIKLLDDGRWEFATSEENAVHYFMRLDEKNYVGTVVAALARASEEQKIMQSEFLVNKTTLNCTIQCHVAGEIHPRVVPGLKPKVTTFDLSMD